MNKLSREKRVQILGLMCEGMSIRAIVRVTGASKNTVVKLLEDAGQAFSDYQDRTLRDLQCQRLQVDEIWAFCYAKQKNVATAKAAPEGAGTSGPGRRSTRTRSSSRPGMSAGAIPTRRSISSLTWLGGSPIGCSLPATGIALTWRRSSSLSVRASTTPCW